MTLALCVPWSPVAAFATGPQPSARQTSSGALATLAVEAPAVAVKPAGKSSFAPAKDGRALKAGDTIRTSPTGRAQIEYSDGSLTRLDVSTEYRLVKLTQKKGNRKTTGLQTAGQTWHRVEALAESEKYQVEGANATAAVLGTAFMVTCVAPDACTFTAVVDEIRLTDDTPRGGTRSITLTPGDQVEVSDDAIGTPVVLSQEELLAIAWITENLLADQQQGKSPGTIEIASQGDPPPTRPPSTPLADPPPPAPTPPEPATGIGTVIVVPPPANNGPVAFDDGYAMPEDTLLVIAAPGVLGNDVDADGDPLATFLTSLPAHGSLTLGGDGSLIYFPDANYHGTDAFTYVAGDGEFGSNAAVVTIAVDAVNDAPVAANDAYATDEDEPLVVAAPGVLGNDSDVDGAALTVVLGTGPANGELTLNPDGSFTYTPDEDFHGTDTFTYRATDGSAQSNIATATIMVGSVNDAPVAVDDDAYQTDEGTLLAVGAPGVLGNDSDVDDTTLTAVLETDVENGTLTLSPDGSFTYEPDDEYTGTDSFTYTTSDGDLASEPATVTITVTAPQEEGLPSTLAVIHEVAPGGTVAFGLSHTGSSATITALPQAGTLLVDGSPITAPFEVDQGDLIEYEAPESEGLQSFTWTATNIDGTTDPITEYLLVGSTPVVPDIFEYGTAGQPSVVYVYVDNPGLGDLTCAVWTQPDAGTITDITFSEDHWTFVFTPDEGTTGDIIVFSVSAGFTPGCDGPWAEGANAYVAVGYTGDGPPPPPVVTATPAQATSAQGEPISFTITASDGNESVDLPLTISYEETASQGPPGAVTLMSQSAGQWDYEWQPSTQGAATVTLAFTVSNGFDVATVTVTLDYQPGLTE